MNPVRRRKHLEKIFAPKRIIYRVRITPRYVFLGEGRWRMRLEGVIADRIKKHLEVAR